MYQNLVNGYFNYNSKLVLSDLNIPVYRHLLDYNDYVNLPKNHLSDNLVMRQARTDYNKNDPHF